MSVVIIDYGSGNLHSAHKAFERAVQEQGLAVPSGLGDCLDHSIYIRKMGRLPRSLLEACSQNVVAPS